MFLDSKAIKAFDVEAGLKKILVEQTPFYLSVLDNLTLQQRNVLQSITNYGGERIFSEEIMSAAGIGPVSSLQTALKLLMKKEILYKEKGAYFFEDVFFKEWIKYELV